MILDLFNLKLKFGTSVLQLPYKMYIINALHNFEISHSRDPKQRP